MAEAYCVKDKMKVEVQNPQQITMKNGKPALSGTCPKCGTQGLQDRRLSLSFDAGSTPAGHGGGLSLPAGHSPPAGSAGQSVATRARLGRLGPSRLRAVSGPRGFGPSGPPLRAVGRCCLGPGIVGLRVSGAVSARVPSRDGSPGPHASNDRRASHGRVEDQEGSDHGHPGRHQWLRPHRSPVAQGAHRARAGRRGRGRQRPRRHGAERAPVQARLDLRRLPGDRRAHRRRAHHRRARDQGPQGEGSGRRCRGATSASTSSSSRPASSPTPRRRGPTSTPARRRSSSAPRPRARTSRSSSASTRRATTRQPITSSATRAAPRTASPRRPRSSTTSSASSVAS